MWKKSGNYLVTKFSLIVIISLALFGFANTDDHFEVNNSFNLTDALKGVINNHKLIKATQIDIKASNYRLRQAKGGYYPSLD